MLWKGFMDDSLKFRGTIAAATATTALFVGLVIAKDRPGGFPLMLALAVATFVVAVRYFRGGSRRQLGLNLLLLSLLFGCFLFGFDIHPRHVSFRLLQVAVVGLYGATILAALLTEFRIARPLFALGVPFAAAGGLLLTEAMAGFVVAPLGQEIPVRTEWTGLLARPVPAATAAPRQAPARPSADSGSAVGAVEWANRTAPTPIWSGRAESDPQLGLSYRPHSTLETLYHDNPRTYFERGDFRSEIWELNVAEGSSAQLVIPPDDSGLLRVAITKAKRDVPPWHIMLNQNHLRLDAPANYALEFRARADRPRTAIVAVTQAGAPFAILGAYDTLELSPEWKSFRLLFGQNRVERNARIHFALGGNDASVEISNVILHDPFVDRVVRPDVAREPWIVRYRFNSLGCRGAEPAATGHTSRRILFLGDGFTTGVGVHERDTFAAQLEGMLNAGAAPSSASGTQEVMNCGIPGYGTSEERRFYQRLAPQYNADMVVVLMGREDDYAFWEADQRANRRRPPTRWQQVFHLWAGFATLSRTQRAYNYTPSVAALLELQKEVEAHHGHLVVVVAQTDSSPSWTQLRSTVTSGLKGSNVPVLDVSDTLIAGLRPDQLIVDATDPHPNERVHAALARQLLPYFLKYERGMTPAGSRDATP
jgi:hypothetical protein